MLPQPPEQDTVQYTAPPVAENCCFEPAFTEVTDEGTVVTTIGEPAAKVPVSEASAIPITTSSFLMRYFLGGAAESLSQTPPAETAGGV